MPGLNFALQMRGDIHLLRPPKRTVRLRFWSRFRYRDGSCLQAVVRLQTSQACRNVKFSSSPVDLLAFSEQTGRVQLIDSRCYGSRQRLWTTPDTTFTGHHISGLAFSPSVCSLLSFGSLLSRMEAHNLNNGLVGQI